MRRTKIIPIRLIQANHDTDGDGVPNRLDCQPLNPHKQEDVEKEKTIMKEIKQTPPTGYQYPRSAPSPTLDPTLTPTIDPTLPVRPNPNPTPPPGYQYVQPGVQYGQQFQIPSRMYDESIIHLPAARFKFITYI